MDESRSRARASPGLQRGVTNPAIVAGGSRRRRWRWLACAALLPIATACNRPEPPKATPEPGPGTTAAVPAAAASDPRVVLAGPTVIAFLPPGADRPDVEGAAEAVAHVGFAMADTRQCLGSVPVLMKTVYAKRLTIADGGAERTIELDQPGQGIGAVLAEPGRPERIVRTAVGASSLQIMLPQAAFEYWHQAACKRQ